MYKKSILRHSIDASFFSGITDIIIKTLTSGSLLTIYAIGMGVSNVTLGFLQSVLPFSNLLHLPVSGLLEKGISPKKIACVSSIISKIFLLFCGLSVFLHGTNYGFILFLFSYWLSYISAAITGGAFWPWCKEFLPHRLTTSFFTRRTQFIILTRMLTIASVTGIISLVQKYDEKFVLKCYGLFFIFSFLVGIIYTYTLFQMQSVKLSIRPDISFFQKIKLAFRSHSFLNLLLSIGFINFSLQFFGPFSIVFLMQEIGFKTSTAMIFTMVTNMADILFLNMWNRYTKFAGIKKTLSSAAYIYSVAIMIFFMMGFNILNQSLLFIFLILSASLIGIGNAGLNLGINDISISYLPKKMSSVYISLLNTGKFFCAGLGSLCAGKILECLGNERIFLSIIKWPLFFVLSIILFIIISISAKHIKQVQP